MDENTIFLAVLVIALLAVAAFSSPVFGGLGGGGPLATPPNPNAEFGVVHERESFFQSFTGFSGSALVPPPPQSQEELLKQYVRLWASEARSSDINREYIEIALLSSADTSVNISDWTVSNSRGESFRIGKATNIYNLTPIANQDSVILTRGTRVYIITGRSPLGVNFRGNKCMGYVNQNYFFIPSLASSCPSPTYEPGQEQLKDECYSYIRNLSSCVTPEKLPLNLDNQCREYIASKFNYYGCVQNHRTDQDFYNDVWWAYLSRPLPIWSDIRETITLRNERGVVIATYSYQ